MFSRCKRFVASIRSQITCEWIFFAVRSNTVLRLLVLHCFVSIFIRLPPIAWPPNQIQQLLFFKCASHLPRWTNNSGDFKQRYCQFTYCYCKHFAIELAIHSWGWWYMLFVRDRRWEGICHRFSCICFLFSFANEQNVLPISRKPLIKYCCF